MNFNQLRRFYDQGSDGGNSDKTYTQKELDTLLAAKQAELETSHQSTIETLKTTHTNQLSVLTGKATKLEAQLKDSIANADASLKARIEELEKEQLTHTETITQKDTELTLAGTTLNDLVDESIKSWDESVKKLVPLKDKVSGIERYNAVKNLTALAEKLAKTGAQGEPNKDNNKNKDKDATKTFEKRINSGFAIPQK